MRKVTNIFFGLTAALFLTTQTLSAQDLSPAPNFDLQDMANTKISLNSYKGKQQVLLFFWTTWCPFCRKELKALNNRYQELLKNGWEVLAIDIGEPAEKITNFLKSQKMSLGFKVLLDKNTAVGEAYGVLGVPTLVFVNKKGQIVYKDNIFPEDYVKLSAR